MKAMVLTMAAQVGESQAGRLWRAAGAIIDVVIPIVLTAVVIVSLIWLLLNPVTG